MSRLNPGQILPAGDTQLAVNAPVGEKQIHSLVLAEEVNDNHRLFAKIHSCFPGRQITNMRIK